LVGTAVGAAVGVGDGAGVGVGVAVGVGITKVGGGVQPMKHPCPGGRGAERPGEEQPAGHDGGRDPESPAQGDPAVSREAPPLRSPSVASHRSALLRGLRSVLPLSPRVSANRAGSGGPGSGG
jgi:hypothetical protein